MRPAALRKPLFPDFGSGGGGTSPCDFLFAFLQSSCPLTSAEEGAVDALLCREEVSVEVVLVVLDDPLPLSSCQYRSLGLV